MSAYWSIIAVIAGVALARAELPSVKIPEKFYQCKEDKDCAVAGDSCRSCGNLIILNRKYLKKFNELDQKERRKKNVHLSCEACSTQHVPLKCIHDKCRQNEPHVPDRQP